jgi:hypothetical protein
VIPMVIVAVLAVTIAALLAAAVLMLVVAAGLVLYVLDWSADSGERTDTLIAEEGHGETDRAGVHLQRRGRGGDPGWSGGVRIDDWVGERPRPDRAAFAQPREKRPRPTRSPADHVQLLSHRTLALPGVGRRGLRRRCRTRARRPHVTSPTKRFGVISNPCFQRPGRASRNAPHRIGHD